MNDDALIAAISRLWRPGNFCVGRSLRCAWQFETTQAIPWETFRGRLVDDHRAPARPFLAWNLLPVVAGQVGDDPLISVLVADGEVHVTRGYSIYAHEADASLDIREVQRWTRELVGSLALADYDEPSLLAEIRTLIRHAVVGTSRLPLTSVEAPHPAFTLGQLAFAPKEAAGDRPMRQAAELLSPPTAIDAKTLEAALRAAAPDEMVECAESVHAWLGDVGRLPALFRRMFNDVSLSPYTEFVDNALSLIARLLPPAAEVDLLAFLLRQLSRHLTAYDLILFHHRGANYPDALLVDALLRRFVAVAAPALFSDAGNRGRMRRRALRQGLLLRRRYEGHAVPDAPTSPGENLRVLPLPYHRVSDEQVEHPHRRSRFLFEDLRTPDLVPRRLRDAVTRAFEDLVDPGEQRELGMALFIERPLGCFKETGEPDATPLLSYEAFSATLAQSRLREALKFAAEIGLGVDPFIIVAPESGLGLDRIPNSLRPAVSLADAGKVAGDFRILRTTRTSLAEFWRHFDVGDLPVRDWPLVARTIVGKHTTRLTAFDSAGTIRLEFDIDPAAGFLLHGGIEVPHGLVVGAVRDAEGKTVAENMRIPLRRVH